MDLEASESSTFDISRNVSLDPEKSENCAQETPDAALMGSALLSCELKTNL